MMELVAQWDAATLLPIIQQHVHPGTVIWSDMSAAYDGVQHLPSVAQPQTDSYRFCVSRGSSPSTIGDPVALTPF